MLNWKSSTSKPLTHTHTWRQNRFRLIFDEFCWARKFLVRQNWLKTKRLILFYVKSREKKPSFRKPKIVHFYSITLFITQKKEKKKKWITIKKNFAKNFHFTFHIGKTERENFESDVGRRKLNRWWGKRKLNLRKMLDGRTKNVWNFYFFDGLGKFVETF